MPRLRASQVLPPIVAHYGHSYDQFQQALPLFGIERVFLETYRCTIGGVSWRRLGARWLISQIAKPVRDAPQLRVKSNSPTKVIAINIDR